MGAETAGKGARVAWGGFAAPDGAEGFDIGTVGVVGVIGVVDGKLGAKVEGVLAGRGAFVGALEALGMGAGLGVAGPFFGRGAPLVMVLHISMQLSMELLMAVNVVRSCRLCTVCREKLTSYVMASMVWYFFLISR